MTVTSMSKLKAFGYRVWILLTRLKKIQNYFALAGMNLICDILYYEYHVEACYEGWLQPIYKGSSAFLQAFAVLG
jgi:hypothetical protein